MHPCSYLYYLCKSVQNFRLLELIAIILFSSIRNILESVNSNNELAQELSMTNSSALNHNIIQILRNSHPPWAAGGLRYFTRHIMLISLLRHSVAIFLKPVIVSYSDLEPGSRRDPTNVKFDDTTQLPTWPVLFGQYSYSHLSVADPPTHGHYSPVTFTRDGTLPTKAKFSQGVGVTFLEVGTAQHDITALCTAAFCSVHCLEPAPTCLF